MIIRLFFQERVPDFAYRLRLRRSKRRNRNWIRVQHWASDVSVGEEIAQAVDKLDHLPIATQGKVLRQLVKTRSIIALELTAEDPTEEEIELALQLAKDVAFGHNALMFAVEIWAQLPFFGPILVLDARRETA